MQFTQRLIVRFPKANRWAGAALALVVTGVLASACREATGPAGPNGVYHLISVSGQTLPFLQGTTGDGWSFYVDSGLVEFRPDGYQLEDSQGLGPRAFHTVLWMRNEHTDGFVQRFSGAAVGLYELVGSDSITLSQTVGRHFGDPITGAYGGGRVELPRLHNPATLRPYVFQR